MLSHLCPETRGWSQHYAQVASLLCSRQGFSFCCLSLSHNYIKTITELRINLSHSLLKKKRNSMLWVGWVSKGGATGYPRVLASLGKVHLRALILGTESMTFWFFFFFTLSQWPKLFHYGKTGNNLLKCLCFCTFLKIDFLRGDWVGWGQGGTVCCRVTGLSSSPVLQLGRGLLPSGLPANPEVLYSLSRVSALCYCFSLFIKCVWITLEMLWLIFFFFSNKDSEMGLKSLKKQSAACCFLCIHLQLSTATLRYRGRNKLGTCIWLQFI